MTGDDTPLPPRFRWVRRWAAVVVGVVLLLLGIRLWWGRVADARLAELVAAATARGEPVSPDALVDPVTPPARPSLSRAADLVTAAAAASYGTRPAVELPATLDWSDAADPAVTEALRQAVAGRINAVALVRLAVAQPTGPWPARPRPWEFDSLTALLRGDAAYHHGLSGRRPIEDYYTVLDLRGVVRLADALSTAGPGPNGYRPLPIDPMVTAAADAIRRVAPTLHVVPHGLVATGCRDLIRQLLDEGDFRAAAVRAAYAVRAADLANATGPYGPGLDSAWWSADGWAARPALVLAAGRQFRDDTAVARAAAAPAWLELPPAEPFGPVLFRGGPPVQLPGAAVLEHFHALTERRAAAVRVAICLYGADHDGRPPAALAALVPAYLPAVPADPMAADGRQLGYDASAGREAISSGGDVGMSPVMWTARDAVFPLDPGNSPD